MPPPLNKKHTMPARQAAYSVSPAMPAADPSQDRVEEFVRRTVGLRVRAQDVEALARWVAGRMRMLALLRIGEYGELLAADSAAGRRERELLTVQFTTGESYFFRDQGQFNLLAAKLLPELIERRAKARRLRLWSAGCAAGEEVYTLAMLLDELAPRLAGWDVLILGSDINAAALERARLGLYRPWSLRSLDEARRQRYFQPCGDQWRIAPRLRSLVTFRSGDLVRDRFPDTEAGLKDIDLILCRNVFIYLDARAIAQITAKFAETLADGGYLITAHSELFGHDIAPLRVRMFAQSAVFEKTERPADASGLGQVLAQAPTATFLRPPVRTEGRTSGIAPREAATTQPAMPAEDCDRLMLAAWRHADRGLPDAAKECCRKAIALGDFDARPYYLLAQLAQERGDTMQAKSLLTKVIYLDPSHIAAYLELGSLHDLTGDSERARRMYETARTALLKLPRDSVLAPYAESTAADVLAYVERLLGAPESMPNGERGVRNDSAFRNQQSAFK
jgi:chemotaxis protein methyltransferase CheR